MTTRERAPVHGSSSKGWAQLPDFFIARWKKHCRGRVPLVPEGTIPWADHLLVYERYAAQFGRSQSAERIADRGGFGACEIAYLGCGEVLERWEPR